jgi:hypothetical protein
MHAFAEWLDRGHGKAHFLTGLPHRGLCTRLPRLDRACRELPGELASFTRRRTISTWPSLTMIAAAIDAELTTCRVICLLPSASAVLAERWYRPPRAPPAQAPRKSRQPPCSGPSRASRLAPRAPEGIRHHAGRTPVHRDSRWGAANHHLSACVDRGTAYRAHPADYASPLARRPYDLRHACLSTWLNGGVRRPR